MCAHLVVARHKRNLQYGAEDANKKLAVGKTRHHTAGRQKKSNKYSGQIDGAQVITGRPARTSNAMNFQFIHS